MAEMLRVGVRELRQNLSKYLKRVAIGEGFRVTERGRPVALLIPVPDQKGALGRLISSGRVLPARGDLLELGPPFGCKTTISISRALEEQRSES
ncbi:MAG: type II toxin-antitoxin system Phd/YefM family antitoxin [Acidobacteriota bacterium]